VPQGDGGAIELDEGELIEENGPAAQVWVMVLVRCPRSLANWAKVGGPFLQWLAITLLYLSAMPDRTLERGGYVAQGNTFAQSNTIAQPNTFAPVQRNHTVRRENPDEGPGLLLLFSSDRFFTEELGTSGGGPSRYARLSFR
jgi:hypothetical protein